MTTKPNRPQTDISSFKGDEQSSPPVQEIDLSEVEYREQKSRYPWWVKNVEELTTEIDRSQLKRMNFRKNTVVPNARFFKPETLEEDIKKCANIGVTQYIGVDKAVKLHQKKRALVDKWLHENTPGYNHEDWALYYAAWSVQYNFSLNFYDMTDKSAFVNVKERYGLEPWKASKQEASKKVEQAAITLGASQIGFAMLDPMFLYQGVSYPPEMKYVIVIFSRWSADGDRRRDTAIGGMDNRVAASRENYIMWALRNFIRGLGYKEDMLKGSQLAFAVMAGLGEMGRMNRMISPIFGGGGRITALVTDLPLATDKPIDFGLQEFCRHCKKCAKACPVGAVSTDKDPSWEPQGEWSTPGKKVWYEHSSKCYQYLWTRNTICSLCLAACPWTKQKGTILHYFAKSVGAKIPQMSKFLVYLDDLFGYGPTPRESDYEAWWDLDLNEYGLDDHHFTDGF